MLSTVNGYINPLSDRYFEAVERFPWLNTSQKVYTVFLSIAAFLMTLPILGVGGYLTFRVLVRICSPVTKNGNYHFDRIDFAAQGTFRPPSTVNSGSVGRALNGGIPNIGNTCFINSAMQMILNTGLNRWIDQNIEPPAWDKFSQISLSDDQLNQLIEQYKLNPKIIVNQELRRSLFQFLTAIEDYNRLAKHQEVIQIFRDVYTGRNTSLSLRRAIAELRSVFVNPKTRIVPLPTSFSQQDAAEFMSAALPGIGYRMNLRKTIISEDARDQSQVDEEAHYLSIPIVHEEGEERPTLQHLIAHFQSEFVNDQNRKWDIVNENGQLVRQHERYWNRYTIVEEIPEVVVMQLKRFRDDPSGNRVKDSSCVEVDEEVDLAPLIDPSLFNQGDSVMYRICGIITHSGGLNGGHYTATVRVDDSWEYRSDTAVKKRSVEQVKSDRESGYMYVFERIHA